MNQRFNVQRSTLIELTHPPNELDAASNGYLPDKDPTYREQ